MLTSVATANLFTHPFEQVLEIIAEAGFRNIELDLFWERKQWAMAQHLRGVPARRVVRMVEQAGLNISSIHDGGGVLDGHHGISGYINPALDQYLDALGYAPQCLVFHTPHGEGDHGAGWWPRTSGEIVQALEKYRRLCTWVTVENMPFFDGYFVPLTTPAALNAFVRQNGLSVTFDTTHYAEIETDILAAARELKPSIKTVHLSDYQAGRRHVFIGEGTLDLAGFFEVIDKEQLNAVTLECSFSPLSGSSQEMSQAELVGRLREAQGVLERWLDGKDDGGNNHLHN